MMKIILLIRPYMGVFLKYVIGIRDRCGCRDSPLLGPVNLNLGLGVRSELPKSEIVVYAILTES